ncbi:MAG TPA: hypothetical protein VJ813_03195 [Vicinamibacterales bacterium]|nr:hypothetical protein [Vicinamibacterales bacterium]
MRRLLAALLTIIVSGWGTVDAARAQQRVTAGANLVFYGDNTEFRNPFREGETIFGSAARLDAGLEISDSTRITIGVFGNRRFGGSSFDVVRPVLALTYAGRRSRFVFGTLDMPHPGRPAGPDQTGPHGLLPPLQRETLAFERPYEAGLQWTFEGSRLRQESWLHWQRLNTPDHRERFDAGGWATWRIRGPVTLPLQGHVVHEGGQLFASGAVRDSLAVATGVAVSNHRRRTDDASVSVSGEQARSSPARITTTLELFGLWSRYTPDRQMPQRTRNGAAFFGRAAIGTRGWRGHLIAWRGDDFVKDEGDPNYLSIRRDGSRYRGVRDYAEAGITRTITLAPGALIETSFRFHRVERHYEYSYRVVGVAAVRSRVR